MNKEERQNHRDEMEVFASEFPNATLTISIKEAEDLGGRVLTGSYKNIGEGFFGTRMEVAKRLRGFAKVFLADLDE